MANIKVKHAQKSEVNEFKQGDYVVSNHNDKLIVLVAGMATCTTFIGQAISGNTTHSNGKLSETWIFSKFRLFRGKITIKQ